VAEVAAPAQLHVEGYAVGRLASGHGIHGHFQQLERLLDEVVVQVHGYELPMALEVAQQEEALVHVLAVHIEHELAHVLRGPGVA
jgi:hypothetical protein